MKRCFAVFVILGLFFIFGCFPDIIDPDPNPTPTPGTVLVFEDFEPDVSSAFGFTSGSWAVVDGEAHMTVLTGKGTGHAAGGDSWTDYEVEVDIRWQTGHVFGPPARGVIVRARGDVDKVEFWGDQNRMWFRIVEDGQTVEDLIARNNNPLPENCTIKVAVAGNTYRAYVNGNLVSEFQTDLRPTGTAGICVGSSNVAYNADHLWFDNFRVTALD